MRSSTSFGAPWATSVRIVSAVTAVTLTTGGVLVLLVVPREALDGTRLLLGACLTLAVLGGAALFTVRGYALEGSRLVVQRLLWRTTVPLDGLQAAWADPTLIRTSIRLFGNGGLFGVTGLFRNRKLGKYRAWVTDPRRAVVLRLGSRTVVVSPEEPARFLDRIAAIAPLAKISRGGPPPDATRS